MNKKILIIIFILISLISLKIFVLTPQGWKGYLVNPMGHTISGNSDTTETPVPPNAPKTFQYDSSTDLKAELDKVNPKILDSDFE